MSEPSDLAAIDALQIRYISALDRRDMQRWLDCFDDEASYVCISQENEELGMPLALMMDDSRARLMDRIGYITKVWAGSYEDYRTKHFVQRIECGGNDGGLYEVVSNFMVLYTTTKGRSEVLVAGTYEDRVSVRDGVARFRAKRAVLDTITRPRYIVYPV
jgi:3-phenylpropionate/cinnamic acid dioxygenase small subunit